MFDTDDQDIIELVGTGLEAILSGETTLEAFIAQHPEQPAALRAELETALWLVSKREEVAPRPGFIPASRKRLVARIQQEARSTGARRSIFGFLWPQRPMIQWAAALIALIVIFSGTGGLVGLAQSSVPGDGLYGIKQASEAVAFSLTVNELDRVEVSANFTQRRLDEAETLFNRQSFQAVNGALQSYETQMSQTVNLLETASNQQVNEKRALAIEVKKNLEAQAVKLEQLQQNAPEDVRTQLQTAEDKALMGAIMVTDESRDPRTATPGPTDTQTPTPTSSPTPSPTPTATYIVVEGEGEVLSTPEPKNRPEKKATNTPRPTNENRPPKNTPPGKLEDPEEKPPKSERTNDR